MNIIQKISSDLLLDEAYVSRIAKRSSWYYRDYEIPKKNGGKRMISQPSAELKTLQYWVVNNILYRLPVSKAAFAYKKGDSIKKHAEMHKQARFIFHTDIREFFPSIRFTHLSAVLDKHKSVFDAIGIDYSESLSDICNICFRKNSLSVGAVSSPVISNIVMNGFDNTILEYCKKHGYVYSRYADDIYISSASFIPTDIQVFIQSELLKLGFLLNKTKTKFYSKKYRQKITGLIITTDGKVSVGTPMRNMIKRVVYQKIVHNIGDPNQIQGYLSFLRDIEPMTYNNLIIKYSGYCDGDIINELQKE